MCVLSISVCVCTHFCPLSWFHTHAYEMPYPQLYQYGFRKIQKGPDTGAYAHEHFLRDRPDELTYVRRMPQSAGTRPYPHMPNLEVAGVHHILAKVHHTHTSTGSPSPGGMSSSVSAGSLPSLSLSSFSPTPSPSASNRGLPKSSGNNKRSCPGSKAARNVVSAGSHVCLCTQTVVFVYTSSCVCVHKQLHLCTRAVVFVQLFVHLTTCVFAK